jgi:hypothetical protein
MIEKPYEFVLEQMAKGTAVPLLDGRKVSEEEEEIKWAASGLYSGGADTVREFH